jgi:hypothetical protein
MKNLLVIFIGIILLSSCKKDDAEDVPQPPTPTNNRTILDSIITSPSTIFKNVDSLSIQKFEYDSQNRVVKTIMAYKHNTVPTVYDFTEICSYFYDASEVLSRKVNIENVENFTTERKVIDFKYNTLGKVLYDSSYYTLASASIINFKLVHSYDYSNNQKQKAFTYVYNTATNTIRNYVNNAVYNFNGNTLDSIVFDYNINNLGTDIEKTTLIEFDNKTNPLYDLSCYKGKLLNSNSFFNYDYENDFLSNNNWIKCSSTRSYQNNISYNTIISRQITYNSNNLPAFIVVTETDLLHGNISKYYQKYIYK